MSAPVLPARAIAAPARRRKAQRWLDTLLVVIVVGTAMALIQSLPGNDQLPPGPSSAEGVTAAEQARTVRIGQEARDQDWSFVVRKVSNASRVGTDRISKNAQGRFILVTMSVTNHGDGTQSMFGDNQYLFDQEGHKYSADTEAAVYLGDQGAVFGEISPGTTLTGVVVFDVPRSVKPASVELHDSAFSSGVDVTLT